MKIRYRQSGGLAGLLRGVDLDSDRLSDPEASALRGWIAEAMRCAPRGVAPPLAKRDGYQHILEVEQGGEITRLDLSGGETCRDLVRWLGAKVAPLRRK